MRDLVTTIGPAPAAHAPNRHGPAPTIEQLWTWLTNVPDPEIPVVSVVDLGIIRNVAWAADDPQTAEITITPTYSGCPTTQVIGRHIQMELLERGVRHVRLLVQLSPPWTTDWLTPEARHKLSAYGIAPPPEPAQEEAPPAPDPLAASLHRLGRPDLHPNLACPRCGSFHTELISRFGSTPCKSLHRCLTCREPFDHFKCH